MSNRITLDELKSYLWNSAVLLRTNIDAGAYKQYIFPLLFFKRICDVYDEETNKFYIFEKNVLMNKEYFLLYEKVIIIMIWK